MPNSFYDHDDDFVPGTLVRANEVNGQLDAIETGFDAVEAELGLRIELPDAFAGTAKIPAQTVTSKLVWIDASGNLNLRSVAGFDADVAAASDAAAAATSAANAAASETAAALSETNAAASEAAAAVSETNAAASAASIDYTWTAITGTPTTLAGYGITDAAALTHNHDAAYLGITAKAADADKLDGVDGANYARLDLYGTHTIGFRMADTMAINWGDGNDLRISHSGGTNYCDIATGQALVFRDGTTNFFTVNTNGPRVHLYDGVELRLGTDSDMEIFHSGGNNYCDLNTGNLNFRDSGGTPFVVMNGTNGKTTIGSNVNAVEQLDVVGATRSRIRIQNNEAVAASNTAITEFWNASARQGYVGHVGGEMSLFSNDIINFYTNNNGTTAAATFNNNRDFLLNGITSLPSSSVAGHGYDRSNNNWKSAVGSTSLALHFQFNNPNGVVGNIKTTGSATQFNTSSDYRLKHIHETIKDACERVNRVPVYRGAFKAEPGEPLDMFLAHEVQDEVPNAVSGEKDGEEMQALDHSKLVPLLWAAVQELTARVKELEGK